MLESRRTQQKQANRRAVTDAAARLFATAGYAGTTMEAVAQASGMSVQGVYFAFQTKANLLMAAIDAARPERPARTSLADPDTLLRQRSEERRVGKECRSRWSRYDYTN